MHALAPGKDDGQRVVIVRAVNVLGMVMMWWEGKGGGLVSEQRCKDGAERLLLDLEVHMDECHRPFV